MGTWHEHDGCQYSNTNYKGYYSGYSRCGSSTGSSSSTSANKTYHNRWDNEDWDDEDDYYRALYGAYYDEEDDIDAYFRKKDSSHDFDKYGCNHADYAYPEKNCHWIKISSPERVRLLKQQAAKAIPNDKGTMLYYFKYDETNGWFIDEKHLEMYDNTGYKMLLDKQDDEEQLLNDLWSDNVMFFDSLSQVEEFVDAAKGTDENFVYYENKYWYVDHEELAAYTDEGLALMFKPGEIGHVRQAIIKDGYNSYSEKQEEVKKQSTGLTKQEMKEAYKALMDGIGGPCE